VGVKYLKFQGQPGAEKEILYAIPVNSRNIDDITRQVRSWVKEFNQDSYIEAQKFETKFLDKNGSLVKKQDPLTLIDDRPKSNNFAILLNGNTYVIE
jgi:hypothetical protein